MRRFHFVPVDNFGGLGISDIRHRDVVNPEVKIQISLSRIGNGHKLVGHTLI